ncbi:MULTISPECIES: YkvI family membrane protein [unclassified Sphingosinithalassobacter]|uniref:YkvI family membrane protein n=1 Tax=unclassified Sphingosinithalassobacter TaxID=2676235 RepID=UPI00165E30E7|nr:hypothetical protein [Sphingosinithalassobacter sp. CS137]
MSHRPSAFQRFLLPSFALKAVVIGGGYATGRELAEFFLPSGPWGGVAAILLAMAIWSLVTALTFLFARRIAALDYRSFFKALLGPAAPLFEVAYLLFVILILAVFGAAAGALGESALGWPTIGGTLALMGCIAVISMFGNDSVERMFKYLSIGIYATYALFLVLAVSRFGGRIAEGFAQPVPATNWFANGVTYASYNIVAAVVILPVVRHFTSNRDAVIAGAIAGPMAMWPALAFYICMIAYYPAIGDETLPSDFLLGQLGVPAFHLVFQAMIFAALLESGVGVVHAINERVSHVVEQRRGTSLSVQARLGIAAVLLIGCMLLADRFGLVALIANGYRALAWMFLAVYVLPLLTIGVVRIVRDSPRRSVEDL